jgi:cytochrome c
MNARITAWLLAAALAPGLAACDGGGQSTGQGAEEESAEPMTDTGGAEEAATAESNGANPPGDQPEQAAAEPEPEPAPEQGPAEETASAEASGPESTQVAAADGGEAAAQQLGCTACHAAETKLVGPPYKAVAERYNGDKAEILERMKNAVKNGAQGNWTDVTGGVPMPPQGQAVGKDQQLEAIAEWVAGMAE